MSKSEPEDYDSSPRTPPRLGNPMEAIGGPGFAISTVTAALLWLWLDIAGGSLLTGIASGTAVSGLVFAWKSSATAALLMLGFAVGAKPRRGSLNSYSWAGAVAGSVAGLVLAAQVLGLTSQPGLMAVAEVLVGLAYAAFLFVWADINCSQNASQIVARLSLSWIISAIVYALVVLEPATLPVVIVLLPIAIALGLSRSDRVGVRDKRTETNRRPQGIRLLPWVILTSIASGIFGDLAGLTGQPILWVYGALAVAIPMLIWVLAAPKTVKLDGLLAFVALSNAVGIFVALLVPAGTWGAKFASAGFTAFYLLLYVAACWMGSHDSTSPGRAVCRWLALFIGLSSATQAISSYLAFDRSAGLAVAAILLVLAAVSVMGNWSPFAGAAAAEIPPVAPKRDERFEACVEVAAEYELSPRETEVLVLLAQGYSIKAAAAQFVVSENTIKTQAHSIYTKVGVHTRQELLALIRERCG